MTNAAIPQPNSIPMNPTPISNVLNNNTVPIGDTKPKIKLPQLQLPTYDGSFDSWLHFKDTFESLIHNNDSLYDVDRLQYLKSSLRGAAADTVQTTSANYQVIWRTLVHRYENKKVIIDNHIKAIFSLLNVDQDNADSLRSFVENLTKQVRALEVLNEPSRDTLLIHIAAQRLDKESRDKWEEYRIMVLGTNQQVTFEAFTHYLESRCHVLESRTRSSLQTKPKPSSFVRPDQRFKRVTSSVVQTFSCSLCNKVNHYFNQCSVYHGMTPLKRREVLVKLKRCINCLGLHDLQQCQSSNCKKCSERHHTTLHQDGDLQSSNANILSSQTVLRAREANVIQSTAIVNCSTDQGEQVSIRTFLDNGSQPNLITTNLVNRLRLSPAKYHIPVYAANQGTLNVHGRVTTTIKSRVNHYQLTTRFLVVDQIVQDLPVSPINRSKLQVPADLALADPKFETSGKIHLFIGSEFFWDLLLEGKVKLTDDARSPYLHNTQFGLIGLGGPLYSQSQGPLKVNTVIVSNANPQTDLERFWIIEEISSSRKQTPDEDFCEKHFANTHNRNEEGRFVVQLSLNANPDDELGDSKSSAKSRFLQQERRFHSSPDVHQQYKHFILEYLDLNRMKLVQDNDDVHTPFHLPHHSVLTPDRLTTKLRVVFDGSAKSSSGKSVNDFMVVGPTIQQDLLQIVLRFRMHEFVLIGDITKMYRQVLIDRSQTHLQRILWRDDPRKPIRTFELLTVTYGTTCAPYLAIKALQQAAHDQSDLFPVASAVVVRDFYVDDLLTLLRAAGFDICKWASNHQPLLADLTDQEVLYQFPFDKGETLKPLGLVWNPGHDSLQYSIKPLNVTTW